MATFKRAEIWDTYVSNSGVRLAVVQHLLRCHGREALDGTDSVEVDFPSTDAAAVATTRQILRLVFADGSFTEWRIRSRHETNSESGTTVTLTAYTPLQDMADPGYITELSSAGMPNFEIGLSKVSVTEVINTYVLPKLAATGYTYFALGTVEPDELEDVVIRKMTPLAVLRALCDTFRDSDTKRPAELRVRRNGTSGYLIDVLRSIGSTASTADLRYKKNLRKTDLTTDSERQATVVQPLGADMPDGTPSGIARVAFRLGTPTGLVYPIEDPEGGPSPVLFEDQLTGYYVVADGINPLVEITASSPGDPATVTLADDTGIQAGQVYELRKNADGEFVADMPSSTTITDYKVQSLERSDILGVRNLIGNGWFRLWPDADEPPTDHGYFPDTATASPFVSQNTDPLYTQLGGKSLKIAMSGADGSVTGLRSPQFFPHAAPGINLHCVKVRVFFKTFSGAAWFYLRINDYVDGSAIKRLTLTAEDNPIEKGYVPTIGSWVDVSIINVDLSDYNEFGCRLEVLTGCGYGDVEGSIECYIDAVQVTQTIGEPPDRYIEYSGSNQLWREGNRVLATFTEPPEHYEIDVIDLTRLDGTTYPFDTLTLGADVRLTDASLGIRGELLRLVEFSLIDYLVPAQTRIKVASRWEQFVDVVNPVGSKPAVTPAVTPGTSPPPPLPPNDGTGAGTPGNRGPFHFVAEAGGLYVIGTHPAASTWLDDTGYFRVPSQFATAITAWGHVVVPGVADSYLDVTYSADEGVSFDSTGIQIPLDIVGPHIVSSDLPEEARVAGTIYRAEAVGGDDDTSPEFYNFAFALNSSTPVGLPDPPESPDPPTGTPWGDIVFDADVNGALFTAVGYSDGDDVDLWPDEIAGRDLTPPSLLNLPKFRATGINASKPCVDWGGLSPYLQCENAAAALTSWTWYFVVSNLDGGDLAVLWGDPFEPPSFGHQLRCDGDSMFGHVNVLFNSDNGSVDDDWDMSTAHIYRWVKVSGSTKWYLFVDGVKKIEASANPQASGSNLVALMNALGGLGMSGKVGRALAYNQAHTSPTNSGGVSNGLTGPELALKAFWGTP